MKSIPITSVMITLMGLYTYGQELTQTIRGEISEEVSEFPIPGVSVHLMGTDPMIGTITNPDGIFNIENVPLGRYDVRFSFIGYETVTIPSVLVHSGKSTFLKIKLTESTTELKQIVIKGNRPKDMPLNDMAAVSARSFSVEETRRYPGGLDDPARLAMSFAGVTMASIAQNAIIIRGNAPKGVLWRMEGVEIPNPSHFAGADITGGGFVTLLSNQVLDNSDFLTGAFTSEYGNVLSGVFDMNLRTGNSEEAEHTVQAGLLGIDIASEGPFSKNGKSSYLFNYRYSTLGLIEPLLPEETSTIRYQDLSFKLNFPTNAGEFSFWGVGGKDFGEKNQELVLDPDKIEFEDDIMDFEFGFNIGATGLTHKLNLGENTLLKTNIAGSINDSYWEEDRLNIDSELQAEKRVQNLTGRITASVVLNHKFSRKHSIRTGLINNRHFYDLHIREAVDHQLPLDTKVYDKGWSSRWQGFYHSRIRIDDRFILNAGFHSQYFGLNEQLTVEPRASLTWKLDSRHALNLGYGNHSQLEDMKIYLLQDGSNTNPNKDLKFARAHHLVFGYDWVIKESLRLKVEPYLQMLYDVPVIPYSSFSMINFEQDWFFNQALENSGKGRNYGIDITLEKFLSNRFYYLITGSVFNTEYKGGDNVWRDSRFNRKYAFNILGGKEWSRGAAGNKLVGLNVGLNIMGGLRTSPVDEAASIIDQDVVFNENLAFSESSPSAYLFDLTFTHRKNKPNYSRVWAIQIKNMFGSKNFDGYRFNFQTQSVEKDENVIIIPNISYKIEF